MEFVESQHIDLVEPSLNPAVSVSFCAISLPYTNQLHSDDNETETQSR